LSEKIALIAGIGVVVCVIATLALWLLQPGIFGSKYGFLFAPLAIILFGVVYILWDRAKNLKAGLVASDEFAKKVNYKAGSYGFIAAIWSAVGAGFLEIPGNYVTAAVVLISGIVFILSYLFMSMKGNAE